MHCTLDQRGWWVRNNMVCLFVGEKNSVYLPNSTFTTYNLVKEAHPSQQYSWIQIPEYGHLDCIYGRDAVHDVYPHILKALDAHAQDNLHHDDAARRHVLRAVKSLEFNSGTVSHKKTNVRFYSDKNQPNVNNNFAGVKTHSLIHIVFVFPSRNER